MGKTNKKKNRGPKFRKTKHNKKMWVGGEPGRTYDDMLKIIKDVEQDIKEKGYTDPPFYEITYTENNTKKVLYGKLFPAYIDYDMYRGRCFDKNDCNDDISRMKKRIYSHVKFNNTDTDGKNSIISENRNVYYYKKPIGLILFEYGKPGITNENKINVMEFYLPWNYLNIFLSLFKEQHTEFFNTVSIKKISEENIKKNLEAAKAAAPAVEPAVPEAAKAAAPAVEPAPVPAAVAVEPVPAVAVAEPAAAQEAAAVPLAATEPLEATEAEPAKIGGTKRNKNRRRQTKRQRK